MTKMWSSSWVVVIACVFVTPSGADDADDYRRAIAQIESNLDYAKGYLDDARREQSDRAFGRIADAQSKVSEVRSLADTARGRNVSTEEKRVADNHFEAARDFSEPVRALDQMKRLEVAFKDAAYPRVCAEIETKLKSHIEKLVYDKDHEGVQKIREFAEQQARPVREKLASNRSQDGYMSSWLSTAQRFSHERGRWRDVRDNLHGAAKDSYEGWKRLAEEAQRACEPITRWEDSSVVRSGISSLGDRYRSKDEYIKEILRALEEAERALEGVERDSNESDILAAVRSADLIEDRLSRLKDVRGTDPRAVHLTERWPTVARQFKEACASLTTMKTFQFHVDRAQQFCQEQEREVLSRVRSLLDSDPFDQNRMALRRTAKAVAADAADVVRTKLAMGSKQEEDMKRALEKAQSFSPDDPEWKRAEKNLEASGAAIHDYYKGAMREATRACGGLALGDQNPPVKEILSGDCSDSQLVSMHDAQVDWCSKRGTRSCSSLSKREECEEAKNRLAINEQCASRRRDIMTTCFRGGDAAHRRALADVEQVREVCMDKVKTLCN